MKVDKNLVAEIRRARENAALLERLKAGETLSLVPPQATWWAPRPLIKKDPDAVKRIFGQEAHG